MSQSSSDADQRFIAAALPSFISEAIEQTEAVEALLLELEEQPDNMELLDSLFLCAHTVKGSAGIFGLSKVVDFAHHGETLLDQMRDGALTMGPELSTLLLECNDEIKFLVASASDEAADTPEQQERRADLVTRLCAHTERSNATAAPAASVANPTAAPAAGEVTRWTISARFGSETFRNGMDPLSIARFLGGLGQVLSMHCSTEAVPSLARQATGSLDGAPSPTSEASGSLDAPSATAREATAGRVATPSVVILAAASLVSTASVSTTPTGSLVVDIECRVSGYR